jgi:eukaryotic-like serine/threonine-protein kinase
MGFAVVGDVIAGRYKLEELVGTGGMSNVYRAHDRLLERTVALKLLHDRYSDDSEYVERFRREARAAARLSHPNIVTVIDRGEQDGRQFIVFEHIDGDNLKQVVEKSGPLPIGQALELVLQIGRALSFAHEHGLVHRDVKPQNVLLNGDGRAKVTDFGIARTVDVEGVTLTGVVLGTSHYISPEQASGERVDAESDVYSLGAVLYELLTGDVPFPGDNFVTVAMRHLREPAPSVLEKRPEVSLRVASAVERALEKDPAARFGSMAEFVDELQACLDQLGAAGEHEPTMIVRSPLVRESPRVRQRATKTLWPLIALVAGLAIAAIVAGILLVRGSNGGGKKHSSASRAVKVSAIGAYDPFGDGTENDLLVANATDGDPSTYWATEHYYSGLAAVKQGVGLVLDAGRSVSPSTVTVTTRGSGFTARIETGNSRTGPFRIASTTGPVSGTTRFHLVRALPARYFVLWITEVTGDQRALVNEIKAG